MAAIRLRQQCSRAVSKGFRRFRAHRQRSPELRPFRVNLSDDGVFTTAQNAALTATAVRVLETRYPRAGQVSRAAANHALFAEQSSYFGTPEGAMPRLAKLADFRALLSLLRDYAAQCADETGWAERAGVATSTIDCWVSIHSDGSEHAPHSHDDSLLSGVYYASVPVGAGGLVLRLPARDGVEEIRVAPREGDLVVFPGSIVHHVEPTRGTDPRVSIAFNVRGGMPAKQT